MTYCGPWGRGPFFMRYFFSRRIPEYSRVLFVESGARRLFESFLPRLYANSGKDIKADLITCYAGAPNGFRENAGTVYNVNDYQGRPGRRRLYNLLAANRYTVAVIICSGEAIMPKWKWMLAARLRVKVLVLNENCDYFWFDRGNWRMILHFVAFRAGLTDSNAVPALGRIFLFPYTFAYLLLYTAIVHLRRKVHV